MSVGHFDGTVWCCEVQSAERGGEKKSQHQSHHPCRVTRRTPPQSPNPAGRHETNALCRNGVDKRDGRQGEKKVRKSLLSLRLLPHHHDSPGDHHDPKRRGSGHALPTYIHTYIHVTNGRRKKKKKKKKKQKKKERGKKRNPVPKESNPGDWESAATYSKVSYICGGLCGLIDEPLPGPPTQGLSAAGAKPGHDGGSIQSRSSPRSHHGESGGADHRSWHD